MDRTDPISPSPSLLKAWGKRMQKGNVRMIPVFVGGAWSLQIPRGNKRLLRLNVSAKAPNA
ncbi:MAG: hypothetical protein HY553_14930 [Elusimicrobia bacterium]|nr:hypothetical protein [Elusimicrobiota bacterium]